MSTQDEHAATAQDQDEEGNGNTTPEGLSRAEGEEKEKKKLELTVEITNTGPCKKHVAIEIPRAEVVRQFQDSLNEVRKDASLPGFRPGRAPVSLVQRRYKKELSGQVKSALLMACMEQLDADHKLNAIAQPNLDLDAVDMPDDGPMKFQFDLEVEPEFQLPEYLGLKLKRPVKTVTDVDIEAQLKQFLERYAQVVPKEGGTAEPGDQITADLTFHKDGVVFNQAKEVQFRLLPELRFQDGHVPDLAGALEGAKPGDVREAEAQVGSSSADAALRGQTIRITFHIHDLKRLRLPELNAEFLDSIGFDSEEELREALKEVLGRRVAFNQRQALRRQVLDQLIEQAPFELPTELVARQEESTLRRQVEEARQAGLSEAEIRARRAELRANAHEQTLRSLKEYFLLAKIAEAEKIEVEPDDVDAEIESIAERADESVRRVRARVEKENFADALAQQILERKTLDFVLGQAAVEDVLMAETKPVETLDEVASPAIEEAPAHNAETSDSSASEDKDAPVVEATS